EEATPPRKTRGQAGRKNLPAATAVRVRENTAGTTGIVAIVHVKEIVDANGLAHDHVIVVEPPRERSTSQERIEKAKQRELMELTRDHRTVFVGQLTQKVRERDLEKFFGSLAKLEHVLLIRDKFTNKSKGFAYVEFSNLEDIPKVLVVNGQIPTFQSFPILIKASEAEKNFAARKDAVFSSGPTTKASASGYSHAGSGGASGLSLSAASRVYVGNLHGNINEDDVKAVFSAFGDVVSVALNRDDIGRSKGFGFVQFTTPDEANLALTKANGLEVAGNFLKVGPVREHEGSAYGHAGYVRSYPNICFES
ncbi:hypothetical protein DYB25_012602, partial [Aphanomyces astaci]